MAVREAYVRAALEHRRVEYIAGVEWREGDDLISLSAEVRDCTLEGSHHTMSFMDSALAIERCIKEWWPDRAYFIEVGNDTWVQLYQPYDIPRAILGPGV
jgi:hypothetical protein